MSSTEFSGPFSQDELSEIQERVGRGRPTKYDPVYCEAVVEYGKMGKSRTWIATEIGVHTDTLYEWQRQHPDFSVAMARAKQWEQRWWEDKGQTGMEQMGFNASVWNRSMAARFPSDWRESTETKTTLDATDNFASLLTKIATKDVFPGDEREG